MSTKSIFSVVLVALVASHGGVALGQNGNELCDDETNSVGTPTLAADMGLLKPPMLMSCAADDPLCDDETSAPRRSFGPDEAIERTAGVELTGELISNCLVQGTEPPPPPPPVPASGDPAGDSRGKSLDSQHYVEYTLDAAGGWSGYRVTVDLASGATGTFASLDYRGANGDISEVRIATVDDATGSRWIAATVVGMPELGVALVPVHDEQVSLALRFAPGSLGISVDGLRASLALPSGDAVEVLRLGHLAVDAVESPVVAIADPRFIRRTN